MEFLKKLYRRFRLFLKIFLQRKFSPIDLWFWQNGDNTYRVKYDLTSISLVLDLGGYKGEWSEKIFNLYQPTILIFEPVSSFQDIILKKFKDNPKIKLNKFGLGGENRKDYISLADDGSSTHRNNNINNVEEIVILDVSQYFRENKLEQVDLMKINIEGEEYPLLMAILQNNLQSKIVNIQVQFHSWIENAESMRMQIREHLSKTHRLTYDYPFVWENWERIG